MSPAIAPTVGLWRSMLACPWGGNLFAMVLEGVGHPLVACTLPDRVPETGEILARVVACAVCRTDLHVIDGELREPRLPLIPGHEIVARVLA